MWLQSRLRKWMYGYLFSPPKGAGEAAPIGTALSRFCVWWVRENAWNSIHTYSKQVQHDVHTPSLMCVCLSKVTFTEPFQIKAMTSLQAADIFCRTLDMLQASTVSNCLRKLNCVFIFRWDSGTVETNNWRIVFYGLSYCMFMPGWELLDWFVGFH